MKTIFTILSLAICFASTVLHAQSIPNNQFEQMNSDGTPAFWGNVYLMSVTIDSLGNNITDSLVFDNQYYYGLTSDAHSGNSALVLSNSLNYTNNIVVAGAAGVDDDSLFSSWGLTNIIPFVNPTGYNPTEFSFYYKYLPANGDSGYASVAFWDSLGNQIGEALFVFSGTTANYTNATIPINYNLFNTASFYSMSFGAFYSVEPGSHQPAFGSRLYIDDVTFENSTGIAEHNQSNIKLFPNPANDVLNIRLEKQMVGSYKIYNAFGQCVADNNFSGIESIVPVAHLSNGIYTLEVKSDSTISKVPFVVCR